MIGLGEIFPYFEKIAVAPGAVDALEKGKEFIKVGYETYDKKWMVLFWYPRDFTFICPTELAELNHRYEEFSKREVLLLACSTDSEYAHLAWRKSHPDLQNLKFPLVADTSKMSAKSLGILTEDEDRVAQRVTIIVDPEGIVRWVCANDMNVPRNVKEILRVLDFLISNDESVKN